VKETLPAERPDETATTAAEALFIASQWQLMWRKLKRHRFAMGGGILLLCLYLIALFAEFFGTQNIARRNEDLINAPPQRIRFFDQGRLRAPFVYGLQVSEDPVTWRRIYTPDREQVHPIRFLVRGDRYKMWGLVESDLHLIGIAEGTLALFGTDPLGRDLMSRTIAAMRISLSIGLIGVALSFILGCLLGGISGFFGGPVDMAIQRVIDFLVSIPTLPLWMALSAALPPEWPQLRVYFGITVILSLFGWPGLARTVRSKLIASREEDFVMAARIAGTGQLKTIVSHLLPSFLSYLIVNVTLSIPGMILGETALSFIGLGLRPPTVSWGVLLQDAQNIRTLYHTPWLLLPGLFVIVVVLSFNFLGDGLRDAADPYQR
jgi:peptide/nickel transport system permease protein